MSSFPTTEMIIVHQHASLFGKRKSHSDLKGAQSQQPMTSENDGKQAWVPNPPHRDMSTKILHAPAKLCAYV